MSSVVAGVRVKYACMGFSARMSQTFTCRVATEIVDCIAARRQPLLLHPPPHPTPLPPSQAPPAYQGTFVQNSIMDKHA